MIGEILKELRAEFNLTQRELAKVINVSNGTIAMYETNKRTPDYETLQKLATYFNVSTDYLLGRTTIKVKPYKLNDNSTEYRNNQESQSLMSISKKLCFLRESTHKTQKEVAEDLNLTFQKYQQYEKADQIPDLLIIKKFANYFNVSIDWLLGQTNKSTDISMSQQKIKEIEKDLNDIIYKLNNVEDLTFDGKLIDKSEREILKKSLQMMIEMVLLARIKEQG